MIIAVGSLHGSPGATSVVMGLAAAWPPDDQRSLLVVEADPDGGVLAARFDDLRADRTLADVAVDIRRGFDCDRVLTSARTVWGGVQVIVCPPSAEQTHSALASAAERLAEGFAATEELDVLIDVGRLTSRSPALPLARTARLTVLIAQSRFEDVVALEKRVPELRSAGCDVGLSVVGDQPYSPGEVAEAADAPLVAALPVDHRSAAVLSGGRGTDRQLQRSLLWRTLSDTASRLAAGASTPRPSPSPPATSDHAETSPHEAAAR